MEFSYRIYNADGDEVEHCGNGARCFALFVTEKRLTRSNPIRVATCNRVLSLSIDENRLVTVDMGQPTTAPDTIPFAGAVDDLPLHTLNMGDEHFELAVVNVGNPHAVLRVDGIDRLDIERLGP